MRRNLWLVFALATTLCWGVWGAYAGAPVANGFPETLIYCVWALTMIPPAAVALKLAGWKLEWDSKSVLLGSVIGLLGAGGQLVLFHAVATGPEYLIFPIISLSPGVTIILALVFLRERTGKLGAAGIALAMIALPLFEYSGTGATGHWGATWFVLSLIVLFGWGLQAYFMKAANSSMRAESIYFYMMIMALLLIPVALAMTDFSRPINWGVEGPWFAAAIQVLNAVGALFLVYAFRFGKAIVVSPLTNAGAPLMTAIIALVALGSTPEPVNAIGILMALLAAVLLSIEPAEASAEPGDGRPGRLHDEPGVDGSA